MDLEGETETASTYLDNLEKEIDTLKRALLYENAAIEKERDRYIGLQTYNARLKKIISDRKWTITEKETTIGNLERKKHQLVEEVNKLKQKQKVRVQFLWKEDGEVTKYIAEALIQAIKTSKPCCNLDVINCMKASEIQLDIPLVLLCYATSDVIQGLSNALKGISVSDMTSVVIVHHKGESVLPHEPSDRFLLRKEFAPLAGVFDLAFTMKNGLYVCKMNETNIARINDFIIRMGNKKSKR